MTAYVKRGNISHCVKYEPIMKFHFSALLMFLREMLDTNNRYRSLLANKVVYMSFTVFLNY